MKKTFLFVTLLPLLSLAQDATQPFTLNGKLSHFPDSLKVSWVFLQYRLAGELKIDSAQPANGAYSFSGAIPEPTMASLRVKYAELSTGVRPVTKGTRDYTLIYLQAGKQEAVSTDSISSIKIKDSKAMSEFAKLNKLTEPYDKKQEPLVERYYAYAKAKDKVNQQKVEDSLDAMQDEMNEKVYGAYVKANPSSPIAMYALQAYAGYSLDADKMEPVFNSLPAKTKAYPSAVTFKEGLDIAKKTGIGKVAMEFTQNDTLDHPISLSAFRGKYVLIDFWASWCGPCRAENPNVVRVFRKYKDKNFHILGVSLDRPGQKEKWLKAIHDDSLTWTHVSDLKFWDNEVAKEYGIRAIPQNLLLDPNGKIIAKNLRGDDLEEKLQEAIGGAQKGF